MGGTVADIIDRFPFLFCEDLTVGGQFDQLVHSELSERAVDFRIGKISCCSLESSFNLSEF